MSHPTRSDQPLKPCALCGASPETVRHTDGSTLVSCSTASPNCRLAEGWVSVDRWQDERAVESRLRAELERFKQLQGELGFCRECGQMFGHDIAEPYAACGCGNSEWHSLTPFMKLQARVQKLEKAPAITLTAAELREALELANPDGPQDQDQLATEVTIFCRPTDGIDSDGDPLPKGNYAFITEYPEEGVMPLSTRAEEI